MPRGVVLCEMSMSWCLCCAQPEEEEEEVDRVELAFQRMDINRDGHVTYAEFRKVTAAK